MTLFEQIKTIPKVDMHINLTSSISTDLAFDLSDANMAEIISKMQERNPLEYESALKLPIKILKTDKNIISCPPMCSIEGHSHISPKASKPGTLSSPAKVQPCWRSSEE